LKHELQALAIDVKMLDEDGNEVDINKEESSEPAALPPIPQEEVVSEEDINDINEDVEVEDDEENMDDFDEDVLIAEDDEQVEEA